jgi:two-component system sensor histidine kinase CiaH
LKKLNNINEQSGARFRTGIVYWVLLTYILAALVWWFISLNRQNDSMYKLELHRITSLEVSAGATETFQQDRTAAYDAHRKNKAKYIGEGSIFFLLILVGAGFVYRSVRKQFNLQQQQQNFMMAITHELKTPISVTLLNLETLQKYNLSVEKQQKILRNTVEETSRLNGLVNNILISSQLESGRQQTAKEELHLTDLLNDCILQFRKRYPDRIYQTRLEPDVEISGDSMHLQMLVNNLVENATKYAPRDMPIVISLEKNTSAIEMKVSDGGPGIPDSEKDKIFSKFYRIGNESTRKTQGTGLGLYLCMVIAREHNADISVTNNHPHGSTFAVTFK